MVPFTCTAVGFTVCIRNKAEIHYRGHMIHLKPYLKTSQKLGIVHYVDYTWKGLGHKKIFCQCFSIAVDLFLWSGHTCVL